MKSKWDIPLTKTQKWICYLSIAWWLLCFVVSLFSGIVWFWVAYIGPFVGLSVLVTAASNSRSIPSKTKE